MSDLPNLTSDFLRGYLACALWTGMDESDESGGRPLDESHTISDFDILSVQEAARECEQFQVENATDLEAFCAIWPKSPDGDSAEAFAGHNFWLTRCGHGTGFWDRDAGECGDRLTEASERAGERWVYLGDDGRVYLA